MLSLHQRAGVDRENLKTGLGKLCLPWEKPFDSVDSVDHLGNFDLGQAGTSYGYGMAAIVRILVFKSWIRHLYVLRYVHCKVPTVSSDSIGNMKRQGQLWHSGVTQQLASPSLNHELSWGCLCVIPEHGPKIKRTSWIIDRAL